jgi:rhamnosyltransferase
MSKIFGIIVTYKPDILILEKCIHSLVNQLNKITIVDNTPNGNNSLERFKNFPNVEIIYLGDNYGIAYAQNVGIKKALEEGADFILLSDQDTIYPLDYVEKMLECFKEDIVAAAGPLFIDAHTGKVQFFVKKGLIRFKKIYPKTGKHEVLQIIASGTIINAKSIQEIGLMKEELFIDWVDMEWCWRAVKKGYKIIGNADVVVVHRLGDKIKKLGYRFFYIKSSLRYYYITRNCVYLSLRCSSLDAILKIGLFLRSFRYILGFSIFIEPHFKNLKYTLKGFYHGIIGKLGKLDEEH